MHEQGKKHKENVEKFLRNIRRKDHENRKEEEKTRRELERIERVVIFQSLPFLENNILTLKIFSMIRQQ